MIAPLVFRFGSRARAREAKRHTHRLEYYFGALVYAPPTQQFF